MKRIFLLVVLVAVASACARDRYIVVDRQNNTAKEVEAKDAVILKGNDGEKNIIVQQPNYYGAPAYSYPAYGYAPPVYAPPVYAPPVYYYPQTSFWFSWGGRHRHHHGYGYYGGYRGNGHRHGRH